jgi:hypothetical protein
MKREPRLVHRAQARLLAMLEVPGHDGGFEVRRPN